MPDDSAPSTKYFRPASVDLALSRSDRGDDVERQRLQLEAHIERDQVVGRDHHHHADASPAGPGSDIRTAPDRARVMKSWLDSSIATAEPTAASVTFMKRAKASSTKVPSKAGPLALARPHDAPAPAPRTATHDAPRRASRPARPCREDRRPSAAPWHRPPARSPGRTGHGNRQLKSFIGGPSLQRSAWPAPAAAAAAWSNGLDEGFDRGADDVEDRRRVDAEQDGQHDQRRKIASSRGVMSG